MCLISNPIEKVSNTKILVAPNPQMTKQLVVYSNYINNISESNAMVLPVPLPGSIQFINLSKYANIFDDCAKCFYNPNKSRSFGYSTNSSNTRNDSTPLEVFNLGSYKVSLAMNLEQISRVDKKIFELSSGLANTLSVFYYQPYWGFIICKLDVGAKSYHPLAYSHDIIDKKIYIPTRHYHQEVKWTDANQWALGLHIDPKQNPLNSMSWNEDNIDQSPMFKSEQFGMTSPEANGWTNLFESSTRYNQTNRTNQTNQPNQTNPNNKSGIETNSFAKMSSGNDNLKKLNDSNYKKNLPKNQESIEYKSVADDWSHDIYLFNLNPFSNENIKKMNSCREVWNQNSLFDPEKINWDFGYCNNFVKIQINGSHPNIDLVIPV